MRNKLGLMVLLIGLMGLLPQPAYAVTLVGGCSFTLTSYPTVLYSVPTASAAQASRIVIDCGGVLTLFATKTWSIQYGAGGSGNQTARTLVHATDSSSKLNYSIRTTSSPSSSILGDGSGGTVTQSGTLQCVVAILSSCASTTQDSFIHIPSSQFVRAGSYSDAMVITVTVN
ncbi:MAG TPA: spore coat protein U domain-containing protein [Limnobacter sp.]|uniref:spore coat protein U domain-containing protein n=1 Tax=Limnobacter sp. TaxID=2003368 RepID=UPI002ED772B6